MVDYNWTSSRERDNFYYTKGQQVFFGKDCENSIVISVKNSGGIEGVRNSLFLVSEKQETLIPIGQITDVLSESLKILKGRISYLKPPSIIYRENLPLLSEREIQNFLGDYYGILITGVEELSGGRNKAYEIQTKNRRYVLKYRGRKESIRGIKKDILVSTSFFPGLIPGKDSDYESEIKGNFYSLEDFVPGFSSPFHKEDYFSLVGKNVALLHNEFNSIRDHHKDLGSLLRKNLFTESNLISMILDLTFSEIIQDSRLKKEAYKLLNFNFFKEMSSFPDQIIHGELNQSNFIWNRDSPKIIDTENLCFSKRISEFTQIILLKGNFQDTKYIPGSWEDFTRSYDSFVDNRLTLQEKTMLPDTLKFFMLRLYTLYNIRRNKSNIDSERNIMDQIELVSGDSHDS